MPGLYGSTSNILVSSSDVNSLYGSTTSNVEVANVAVSNTTGLYNGTITPLPTNAQTIFQYLTNTGNVKFSLVSGNTLIQANDTDLPFNYTNANVGAYLPTDATIIGIQANIVSTNANVVLVNSNVATLNDTVAYEVTSLNNKLIATDANVAALAAEQYTNADAQAYIPTDPTIVYIQTTLTNTQGNVAALFANATAQQNQINSLTTGAYGNSNVSAFLPTYAGNVSANYFIGNGSLLTNLPIQPGTYSNANLSAWLPQDVTILAIDSNIATLYANANTQQGLINGLQTGLNSSNTTVSNLQTGLNSANVLISNVQGEITAANVRINDLFANATAQQIEIDAIIASGGYSNVQVAAYLPTYTGNVGTGAGYIFGNAAFMTGIPAGYTDEQAQDATANLFAAGTQLGVSYTYDDTANSMSSTVEAVFATVTNAEATTITKGQVVYLYGAQGNRATVKLAYNASDVTSSKTMGIVYSASIAPNGTGVILIQGSASGFSTGGFNPGDILYLGATPGSITATKPVAPEMLVYIGIVERANNGAGIIFAQIQNGYELDELHDVSIVTPTSGQVLQRGNDNLWHNQSLTTSNVSEGTNLYFTNTRVQTSVATGVSNILASGIVSLTNSTNSTGAGTGALQVSGGASFAQDVYIQGNLTAGNLNVISTEYLIANDPLVYFQASPTYPYNYDIGFYSHFTGGPSNIYQHSGVVRDYVTNDWFFFSNITAEPMGNVIGITSPNIVYDGIRVGKVTAAGNVTSPYFIGDGSLLTNLPVQSGTYSNTNVNSFINTTITTSNITEGTRLYYTTTRFNTDFGTKSTTDLTEGTNLYYTDARSRAAISVTGGGSYNSTTGVITINSGGSSYGDANVASYLAGGTLSTISMTGGIVASNILLTGLGIMSLGDITSTANITSSAYFIGDGSQLTNLPVQTGTYSNTNVASYLPVYTGNIGFGFGNANVRGLRVNDLGITSITGSATFTNGNVDITNGWLNTNKIIATTSINAATVTASGAIEASGNITGSYIFGNGAFLTGISGGGTTYGDSNVAAFLPTYTGNVGTGTGYIFGNGSLLTGIPGSTFTAETTTGGANLRVGTTDVKLASGSGISITRNSASQITITNTGGGGGGTTSGFETTFLLMGA